LGLEEFRGTSFLNNKKVKNYPHKYEKCEKEKDMV
jgi:hypothetical protein